MKKRGLGAFVIFLLSFFIVSGGMRYNEIEAANKFLTLDQVRSIALKQFEVKDNKGNLYNAYLYAEDVRLEIATIENGGVWGGINEGDVIASGTFKIAYAKAGERDYRICKLDDWYYGNGVLDLTAHSVRKTVSNTDKVPDLISIYTQESSSNGLLYNYGIVNGTMLCITPKFDEPCNCMMTAMGAERNILFSSIGNGQYKSAVFDNSAEFYQYHTYIWQYDARTNQLVEIKHYDAAKWE